jgi:hypothetical protein
MTAAPPPTFLPDSTDCQGKTNKDNKKAAFDTWKTDIHGVTLEEWQAQSKKCLRQWMLEKKRCQEQQRRMQEESAQEIALETGNYGAER